VSCSIPFPAIPKSARSVDRGTNAADALEGVETSLRYRPRQDPSICGNQCTETDSRMETQGLTLQVAVPGAESARSVERGTSAADALEGSRPPKASPVNIILVTTVRERIPEWKPKASLYRWRCQAHDVTAADCARRGRDLTSRLPCSGNHGTGMDSRMETQGLTLHVAVPIASVISYTLSRTVWRHINRFATCVGHRLGSFFASPYPKTNRTRICNSTTS
jgi:hypothetical protein